MTDNPRRILSSLDARLDSQVELTLYGRAALLLGFDHPPETFGLTRDVDAVLWKGQSEDLLERSNFWNSVAAVNEELRGEQLFISHFFQEDQVILCPDWRERRVRIEGPWKRLELCRLGDMDLLLSKLMRDDPIDHSDALFIVRSAGITLQWFEEEISRARVPDIEDLKEEFSAAARRLIASWPPELAGNSSPAILKP